jgi:hypothetical protein
MNLTGKKTWEAFLLFLLNKISKLRILKSDEDSFCLFTYKVYSLCINHGAFIDTELTRSTLFTVRARGFVADGTDLRCWVVKGNKECLYEMNPSPFQTLPFPSPILPHSFRLK